MSGPVLRGTVQAAEERQGDRARSRSVWYLRSLRDHDTHCGELGEDGLVVAECGVIFTPRPTLQVVGPAPGQLVAAGPALKGNPSDPEQVCRECRGGGRGVSVATS